MIVLTVSFCGTLFLASRTMADLSRVRRAVTSAKTTRAPTITHCEVASTLSGRVESGER